ncbi:TetR/AcrR family transcriptional regulator [Pontibacter sp. CAU 1760]
MENIADKKKAIFESTMELVREKGFHGTPMSMVAKHAGVAAGTIYHYFESKDQLICELFSYAKQQVMAVVEKEACQVKPFKACFFNLWFGLYAFYLDNPNVLKFFEQFVNSPYSTKLPALEQDKFYLLLFEFYERGITEGHLKQTSSKILGTMAFSSVISAAKLAVAQRLVLKPNELKQLPQILWDGMKLS